MNYEIYIYCYKKTMSSYQITRLLKVGALWLSILNIILSACVIYNTLLFMILQQHQHQRLKDCWGIPSYHLAGIKMQFYLLNHVLLMGNLLWLIVTSYVDIKRVSPLIQNAYRTTTKHRDWQNLKAIYEKSFILFFIVQKWYKFDMENN